MASFAVTHWKKGFLCHPIHVTLSHASRCVRSFLQILHKPCFFFTLNHTYKCVGSRRTRVRPNGGQCSFWTTHSRTTGNDFVVIFPLPVWNLKVFFFVYSIHVSLPLSLLLLRVASCSSICCFFALHCTRTLVGSFSVRNPSGQIDECLHFFLFCIHGTRQTV